MNIYMAPMESLTGYIYRNAFAEFYGGIDKYFTPFIASKKLSSKEKNDILPEHNKGLSVIPQILANKPGEFLSIAKQLENYGYDSVNLNLGCPSGTVTAKKRGAGFLSDLKELENFLTEIFERCPLKISVKTRIGIEDESEWEEILKLYNQFPLDELIIHPRLRKDFYSGRVRLDAYELAVKKSRHSLCYNGDICSSEDYSGLLDRFPETASIMLGRGLLARPSLANEIRTGSTEFEYGRFRCFHECIYNGYKGIMSGDRNVLFKMKELWVFMGRSFPEADRLLKQIQKCNSCTEYEMTVSNIFAGLT